MGADGYFDIWTMRPDAAGQRCLTCQAGPLPQRHIGNPAWHPSGAFIVFQAQKAGVPRHAFLDFMNKSVMGSVFTKYKTPGWVNLDWSVTFTPELLRKDMDLGLALGRKHEVPMPTAVISRDIMQSSMGQGNRESVDFSILMEYSAKCSGIELESENVEVASGLEAED